MKPISDNLSWRVLESVPAKGALRQLDDDFHPCLASGPAQALVSAARRNQIPVGRGRGERERENPLERRMVLLHAARPAPGP